MKNLLIAPSLLACVAFATPALAQVNVRDHRVPVTAPAARAADFSPKAGPVGTLVTIDGRGLSSNTTVLVGGTAVRRLASPLTS